MRFAGSLPVWVNRNVAFRFKESCYDLITKEVEKERELGYPLQIKFILENYDNQAPKRVNRVLEHLKPADRNILMLELVLSGVKGDADINREAIREVERYTTENSSWKRRSAKGWADGGWIFNT